MWNCGLGPDRSNRPRRLRCLAQEAASSSNPRQFIQRRGRILRPFPGKDKAELFDMIVVPPASAAFSDAERGLVRKELTRFAEFADIALNAGEARGKVLEVQKRYGLLDM